MQTTLHKAISVKNGRWYTGSYRRYAETTYCFKEDYEKLGDPVRHLIHYDEAMDWGLPNNHYAVDIFPETLCQAVSGLIDKNHKQIFENDIVNIKAASFSCKGYVVRYNEDECRFVGESLKTNERIPLQKKWEFEVVGNTFDHYQRKAVKT